MPGKMNMGKATKKNEEIQRGRGGKFFKAPEGDTTIRILPPWSEDGDWPFLEVLQHSIPGALPTSICGKSEVFLNATGGHCYICDVVIPMLKDGSEEDQSAADNLEANPRVYANIIDRDNPDAGVMIWNFSRWKTYTELLTYVNDTDYGDITDPISGTDIILNRKGTDFTNTRYSIRPKRTASKLGDEFLENVPQLDELLAPRSASKLRKLFLEEMGVDFGGTDEADENVPFDEDPEDVTEEEFVEEESVEEDPSGGESVTEDGIERLPILMPANIKGLRRKKAIEKEILGSECFGVAFDEHSEDCEACDAMINCAGALVESEEESVNKKKKPKPRATRTTRRKK